MTFPIFPAVNSEDLAREGLTDSIAPWEDGLRADTGPGFFEWWYFDCHFDDSSTAVIVFTTKPILERNGPLKPNVSLTITPSDGTKIAEFVNFPASEFSAAREKCDVRIGNNVARVLQTGTTWQYEVNISLGDIAANLTFSGLVPPWRPGAGKVFFGDRDHYFAWLPAIPYGSVSGTLTYNGTVHHVVGTGYHDHNWGNVGLHEVMDHWYWGRAYSGDYTLIFVEQITAKQFGYERLPVFMLARGDRIIADEGQHLAMRARDFVTHSGGRKYPQSVDFQWQNEDGKVSISLRNPVVIEAVSLLLTFPLLKRILARLFANPYYFRFKANLSLSIDLPGEQIEERGSALYEIMMFK